MSTTPTQDVFQNTYLAFLRNNKTGEEFIAPATGSTLEAAAESLRDTYPTKQFELKTLYAAQAVQQYLRDLTRWPGLPSKVQGQPRDVIGSTVANPRISSATGSLPPLKKPAAATAPLSVEHYEQIRTIAQGLSPETRALAAKLIGERLPEALPALQSQSSFKDLSARIEQSSTQPKRSPMQPVAKAPQGDLKSALQALRGVSAPAAAPSTEPVAASALPASARGRAEANPITERTLPSQLVGKVSAISVLKALRTAR